MKTNRTIAGWLLLLAFATFDLQSIKTNKKQNNKL